MREVTDAQRRARLGTRHALSTRADSVLGAVERMTCLHATEPASVYLSAFARAEASRPDMDGALYAERSVVDKLAMRRTLFAFPRDLLPAVWGSASARVLAQCAPASRRRWSPTVWPTTEPPGLRPLTTRSSARCGQRDLPPPPSCGSGFRPWPNGWSSHPARPTAGASRSHPGCLARSVRVVRSCAGRTMAAGTSRGHGGS